MAKETVRINCLLDYCKENGFEHKEPIEDKEKKEALKYEMNVITKRPTGQKWDKRLK